MFLELSFLLSRSNHLQFFLKNKVFWKYAANSQENTHAEVRYQYSCSATLLKSHFGMGVLLYICCTFSEYLFLETPLSGCFWVSLVFGSVNAWFVTALNEEAYSNYFQPKKRVMFISLAIISFPYDTGGKLDVHKTSRRFQEVF